jgi:replicative DNA helicase
MGSTRTAVSADKEKKIITSMITSTSFLKEIITVAQVEYFSTSFSKTIFRWIKEFFEEEGEAPQKHIQDLFEDKKHTIDDEEDIKLIDVFLKKLNEEYGGEEPSAKNYENKFNEAYYIKQSIDYFAKQKIKLLIQKLKDKTENDDISEAEHLISNFKAVEKLSAGWVDIGDRDFIERVWDKSEKNKLIRFPRGIHEVMGEWNRGWLVCIQSAYGSGKSFLLQEVAFLAMAARLNVVFVSLEMDEVQFSKRAHQRKTGRMEKAGEILIPKFDCYYNQTGDCTKSIRTCHSKIRIGNTPKVTFEQAPHDYKICTECRGGNGDFKVETWFEKKMVEGIDNDSIYQAFNPRLKGFGRYLKLMCYPKLTANLSRVDRDLDLLFNQKNFAPDVIIVDYADILMAEDDRYENDEGKFNTTYMSLARMAKQRDALVVTVSQINTATVKSDRSHHGKMGDASGSSRAKYAHPDMVCAMMQTNLEKASGVTRFNIVKSREGHFNESQEVYVLQQLALCHAMLDCEKKPLSFE